MNNVLEFYIKMKDLMSGSLGKLAQTSKQTFNKIQNDVKTVQKVNKDFMYSIDGVRSKLLDAKRVMEQTNSRRVFQQAVKDVKEYQKELDTLEGKARDGNSVLSSFARYASVAAIAAGAFSFAKASVNQYADFEKSGKTYQVLARNKGIGTALSGELNELKQNSILGTSVYPNSQMLMAFGDRADKVIPHLNMIGDIGMGDPDKMHRLAYAFGEVEAAGRLTGRQVMQMTNAGFNPLNQIARDTGESMESLRSKMRKGEISFREVEKAMESATGKGGMFHNMMNEMADTTSGKMLMLKGKVAALEIAVGELLAPAFKSALGIATSLVTTIKHWVEIPVEQKITDQISKIRGLQSELFSANVPQARQIELLNQLEQLNPKILDGIDKQKVSYAQLAKNIDDVTGALQSKIFMEKFDKANAGVLTDYAQAQSKQNDMHTAALTMLHQIDPALAQRQDLSLGQKEMMAQDFLKQKIKTGNVQKYIKPINGPGGTMYLAGTKEQDQLGTLVGFIQQNKNAASIVSKLQPQINEINKTKTVLSQQIDQYLSVKSMVKVDQVNHPGKYIKPGDNEGNEGGSGTGNGLASGITGGGPRTINIHIGKMVEKIEVNASDSSAAYHDIEHRVEELFLRLLNSGANLQ